MGRSRTSDWTIEGNHFAERCALFVIIALGESLLVTGATFADLSWTIDNTAAFVVAVLGSIALWWIYFDTGAERGHHRIASSDDPGRQARSAYTYCHLPIVAGIIVCAVADELVLAHPDHVSDAGIAVIIGGPALFMIGTLLFKWVTSSRPLPPLSHLSGLAMLLALTPLALTHLLSAVVLSAMTTGILIVVAGWESVAIRRQSQADEHAPHQHHMSAQ